MRASDIFRLVLLAAIWGGSLVLDIDVNWRRFWRQYLIIGALNAALRIAASYSAILNATSPFFGVLFAGIWLGEKITPLKSLGFVLGITGVVWSQASRQMRRGAQASGRWPLVY